MNVTDAIQVLMDCASRWADNAEEEFPRRLKAEDTDEELKALAGELLPEATEIRDLWLAIKIVTEHLDKPIEGAPR